MVHSERRAHARIVADLFADEDRGFARGQTWISSNHRETVNDALILGHKLDVIVFSSPLPVIKYNLFSLLPLFLSFLFLVFLSLSPPNLLPFPVLLRRPLPICLPFSATLQLYYTWWPLFASPFFCCDTGILANHALLTLLATR